MHTTLSSVEDSVKTCIYADYILTSCWDRHHSSHTSSQYNTRYTPQRNSHHKRTLTTDSQEEHNAHVCRIYTHHKRSIMYSLSDLHSLQERHNSQYVGFINCLTLVLPIYITLKYNFLSLRCSSRAIAQQRTLAVIMYNIVINCIK